MICVCSSQYLGRPDTEEYERGLEEWAHRREEDERRHQAAERELALARERALSPAKAAARAEARSPDADDERRFAVGDEVRFRYGRFGVIAKTNPDGTYDVRYDDGDEERGVESRMIRKLAPNEVERKRAEARARAEERARAEDAARAEAERERAEADAQRARDEAEARARGERERAEADARETAEAPARAVNWAGHEAEAAEAEAHARNRPPPDDEADEAEDHDLVPELRPQPNQADPTQPSRRDEDWARLASLDFLKEETTKKLHEIFSDARFRRVKWVADAEPRLDGRTLLEALHDCPEDCLEHGNPAVPFAGLKLAQQTLARNIFAWYEKSKLREGAERFKLPEVCRRSPSCTCVC